MNDAIGKRFAQALADKDSPGLLELLDADVDFKGLTPGRFWEADSAKALVDDVFFGPWFGSDDHIDSLDDVQVGCVVDRDRVSYLLRVSNPAGVFLVEQQAYFAVEDDRITWLRILCAGYRRIEGKPTKT